MDKTDKTKMAIRTYFKKLGLDAEIADIYLALHAYGPQSISALARNSKVERTRIYRLIDQLIESNLVEVEAQSKRGVIKAAPVANVRILINQRQEELKNLQDELELVEQTLARNSLSNPAARVQFYHGPEGIRQMLWSELDAKTELVGYGYRLPEAAAGKKFIDDWNSEFEKRRLVQRLVFNDDFADSWLKAKAATPAKRRVKGVSYQLVDPKYFRVGYSCDIYDNVVAYCHWDGGEVYGVEIHNQAVADGQRQLFELAWLQSRPEDRF